MKPLIKLCEETNQLIKEMLKQTTDQTRLINEWFNVPRELQKTTEKLSHIVHMVCSDYKLLHLFLSFFIVLASQSITNTTTK